MIKCSEIINDCNNHGCTVSGDWRTKFGCVRGMSASVGVTVFKRFISSLDERKVAWLVFTSVA